MPNLCLQEHTDLLSDHARLVSVEEAAKFLGVPESWLYDRTRRNAVPCIRLGKYVRFNLRDLLAWAKSGE
jgi:excisionase family DNA binding protein